MRLSEFIRLNEKAIISEWENYARTCPPSSTMTREELRDGIIGLLNYIADELETPVSLDELHEKAKQRPKSNEPADTPPREHAEQRFKKGFDTLEMVTEYRVLRATVMKLWICPRTDEGVTDLNRYHETIDELIAQSLRGYTDNEKRARSLFLGTLMHDMKNPINAILQAVQLLTLGKDPAGQPKLLSIVDRSARRINQLVSELIDAVRLRLGGGIPVAPTVSNIGNIAAQVIDEIRITYPTTPIKIETSGDLVGEWDGLRAGQMISNLVANAVQHGGEKVSVDVKIVGETDSIVLTVHNFGNTIPEDLIPVIFDPLTTSTRQDGTATSSTNLGLGLFIAYAIVTAHDGDISVSSTEAEGTTFKVRLPRKFRGKAVTSADSDECSGPLPEMPRVLIAETAEKRDSPPH